MISTIRNHSAYVDALGNTVTQFYSQITINVDTFNSIRSSSSYSQLGWVVHLLQNFLARNIVMMTSFLICTAQVIIDMLLAVLNN